MTGSTRRSRGLFWRRGGSPWRSSSGSGPCDGLWRRTLGAELAEHRYPDSPRRIRVLRCRRDLDRHGYWLRAPLRRNRHDNPFTRVSVALSTESPQSRRNPGIRCAATLLAASSSIRKKSLRPAFLGRLGSPPRIRQSSQLCAKGQMRRSHQRSRRRRDERPVINPPTDNRPTGTRSNSISLPGRPRSNPLTRVSTTLSPECQKPSNCRSGTTSANASTTSPPATPERRERGNDS